MKTQLTVFFIFVFLVFSREAQAYIDPGSGSFIFQIIVASVVGWALAIKTGWRRVSLFFRSLLSRKKLKQEPVDHDKTNSQGNI